MIVGTAVPTSFVGTIVPTMIAGTKISFTAVPTTLVETAATTIFLGTAVSTMIAGTKSLWCLFQQLLLGKLFLQTFLEQQFTLIP